MPLAAKKLANSKEAGKFIPKLLVTSADGKKPIGAVTYEQLKDDARKAARAMRKKIEQAKTEDEETESAAHSKFLAPEQEWTNAQGKTIRAAVVSVAGGSVEFLMKGKQVTYPMSKLSDSSKQKLESLMP